MKNRYAMKSAAGACLLIFSAGCTAPEEQAAPEKGPLEGTWLMTGYLKADSQIRYQTDGYMMFGKEHWLHLMYFNRDARALDFSEAHHGTYTITGPDTLDLVIDMELHMDPKVEYQDTPVWYGEPAIAEGSRYLVEGDRAIIDLPSSAQLVLERIE